MKKHYEKPEIQVVALELSEAIANCAFRPGDPDIEKIIDLSGANFSGDIDSGCTVPLDGYCYFTSASILANS